MALTSFNDFMHQLDRHLESRKTATPTLADAQGVINEVSRDKYPDIEPPILGADDLESFTDAYRKGFGRMWAIRYLNAWRHESILLKAFLGG